MQRRKDNKGRVLKDGEVYRKSDGLYMYRWTAKNGKRHTIYDATLEGLREKEEKIQHDLADGLRIPECSLTLNDLFELWRKNKVGLKEHTFANYVYMYNRFVRDEIGMMKLKDIRKSYIRSYYNGIVRNGKMALNTLETIQNVLHQSCGGVDDEYIRVNPTDGVLTAIKAAHQYETPKRHALTLPQQQAFLNFIKKTPKFQHWLPMFTFMLGTGCRISETVGLCWSDIDFESGFITIRHNLVYHDHEVGGCYFTMSTPKTAAGKRTIPILPEVQEGTGAGARQPAGAGTGMRIRDRRNLGLRIPEPLRPAAEPADGQSCHQAHQRGIQRSRTGKGRKGKAGTAVAAAFLLP